MVAEVVLGMLVVVMAPICVVFAAEMLTTPKPLPPPPLPSPEGPPDNVHP
jgi:hypothetical protein